MKTIFPIITEDTMKLPVYVKGIGFQGNEGRVLRPGGFYAYQWLQCVAGSGRLIVDGNQYEITEGMGFFFYKNLPHEYYSVTEPWTTKWVLFDGDLMPVFLKQLNLSELEVIDSAAASMLEHYIGEIYSTIQSISPLKYTECSSLIYSLICKLGSLKYENQKHDRMDKYKKLQPVKELIEKKYASELTLDEMAAEIGVTTSYFCRLFSQAYSLSPVNYLNMFRIQRAKVLLLDDVQLEVQEISRLVGFNGVSYFCSVFKELEGCTPLEFRRKYRGIRD